MKEWLEHVEVERILSGRRFQEIETNIDPVIRCLVHSCHALAQPIDQFLDLGRIS